MYIVYVDVCDV